uniref:NADH-ubiquinone oxidoreductase chain 4 n=1 Tax=Sphaeroma serratum TaxID=96875 RepID=E3SXB5_SPHSR|nr:NADH dehydrogenase subunit 4 [Sphaeroma serratum]
MMMLLSLASLFSLACSRKMLAVSVNLAILSLLTITLSFHYNEFFLSYSIFNLDSISAPLISLTLWITLLSTLASSLIFAKNLSPQTFSSTMLILMIILVLTFSVNDTLLFYVLFEASLIPTFALILGWGYQPERLQAGIYLLLYTVLASLPLLLLLSIWTYWGGSPKFSLLPSSTLPSSLSPLWFAASVAAFSFKLPIYAVHLWLPKAHVEAPVAGSMILAGILLKLGGYGLLRISSKIFKILSSLSSIWIIWAMVGGAIVSLVCLTQTDIKLLIALSSVAHMAMVGSGVLTASLWGINGAMLIMIGHGFCSSGLFCIANMTYERTQSRNMMIMKGMLTIAPALTLWWFLLATSNMAAPPSLNLYGEIHAIISLLTWSPSLMVPIISLTFLAAGYSLFMYATTQHGKPSPLLPPSLAPTPREFLILALHWFPLNILILNPLFLFIQS